MEDFTMEKLVWEFFDKCKPLFFPEQWNKTFLDFSKNDLFVLLFLYRNLDVTMTEIASYLGVPLNTVTGVVNRLEKKELLVRERQKDDRRVVIVRITETGNSLLKNELAKLEYYYNLVITKLSKEEVDSIINVITKLFEIITTDTSNKKNQKKIRKIVIE